MTRIAGIPDNWRDLVKYLPPAAQRELDTLLINDRLLWRPLPGPQSMAYHSNVDVLGYGGAAGGGKTDLAIGKALNKHTVSAFFRREGTELTAVKDRLAELLGDRDGFDGRYNIWRPRHPLARGKQIEFGSVPNTGDEENYRGRPKDLLVIDEAGTFPEPVVRFLMGWVRTVRTGQSTQTLLCFNPPRSQEGRWLIEFFGPWLDRNHPLPAMPGEVRYFASIKGKEVEVATAERFTHAGELVIPMSRSFVPARVADNPYLMGTNYMATLQALPEPLRSQMLYGDFYAGTQDDAMQVIPTKWVEAAMDRWKPRSPKPRMDSVGVDVARGGEDNTVIARRHSMLEGFTLHKRSDWYDEIVLYPGKDTPDGPIVAGVTVAAVRDAAPIHIDVIGVGASPYDFLRQSHQTIGVNVAEKVPDERDLSGLLGFFNLRSMLVWRLREMLDPANGHNVELPPDRVLKQELCTYRWDLRGANLIYVEGRDEIMQPERLGRSPDRASAIFLASIATPRASDLSGRALGRRTGDYNPLDNME